MSRGLAFVAALSVLGTAAVCGGETVDPVATYPYPLDGAFDQAVTGGVLVRDGNCLYMETPGLPLYFLAFPEGVAFWDDGRLVVEGVAFSEGDTVTFGGGEGWFEASPWVTPPDEDCDLTNVWRASGVPWPSTPDAYRP